MILYLAVVLFPLLIGALVGQEHRQVLANQEDTVIKKDKNQFIWLLIAALPMFLLIALRDGSMGNDTANYQAAFLRISTTEWSNIIENTRMEYGFLVFNKLISYITSSVLVYQIIYTSIYLISVVNFAYHLEKGSFFFLYLFGTLNLYMFLFTGVRQCLAMCICLWSYKYIKKRKIIPVILIIALASTFHKSSVVFILAYIIYSNKVNFLNSVIYLLGGIVAFFNIEFIQSWFNENLGYDYGVEETGNGLIFFLVIIIITAYSMIMIFQHKNQKPETMGFININFLTVICWILRLATRIAERPSYYFMFFTIAMLCAGVYSVKDNRERVQMKTLIIVATIILYIYRLSTNFSSFIPYQMLS